MMTYRRAGKLLTLGDIVYSLDGLGDIRDAIVQEICPGWLETTVGILDFDDHGCTWWLTRKVAAEYVMHI